MRFVVTMVLASVGLSSTALAEDAPTRPAFDVAVGMGVSFDDTGLDGERGHIPAFGATLGFGGKRVGFLLAMLTTEAQGRYSTDKRPVDRLAWEALCAFRPAGTLVGTTYGARVARSFAFLVGPGYERVTPGRTSASRFGLRLGASVDVPITPAAGGSDVRVRFSARVFSGPTVTVADREVGNSRAELLGALAIVF